MKEIDFLPEWYKSGKRREVSYRTQYIALSGVLVVMMVWNFITTQSLSKARSQFAQMEIKQIQAEGLSINLDEFKNELKGLQVKAEIVEEIDSKINVSNVLAELSFLINEKILLNNVEFIAEKIESRQQESQSPRFTTVVRAVRNTLNEKQELPLGDVRFRVVISGVAADAADVAALIVKLESSPYFCQVVPSFSRNVLINTAGKASLRSNTNNENINGSVQKISGKVQLHVSEFEINSYLANYNEQ
jgi:hypothetical protein